MHIQCRERTYKFSTISSRSAITCRRDNDGDWNLKEEKSDERHAVTGSGQISERVCQKSWSLTCDAHKLRGGLFPVLLARVDRVYFSPGTQFVMQNANSSARMDGKQIGFGGPKMVKSNSHRVQFQSWIVIPSKKFGQQLARRGENCGSINQSCRSSTSADQMDLFKWLISSSW